ncbi:LOW QUALITY PROTEIN: uncharacterized protein LOC119106138 [Pollicipes pollicipes]|uniref:LOW QUALITY PROTEIN: uncharacterized protein LOC119106138 n=1 Tax=Pollicipes pollicipes TaxID=41117 RepID=UPI001884AB21|nr:LOW QUALITY PROTEIN: uncharacterized protein LOC119106138 [Pollicipes pollicipes]
MRATLLWSALLLSALRSDGARASDCVTGAEGSCLPNGDLRGTLPPQGAAGTGQVPEQLPAQAPDEAGQPPGEPPEQPPAQAPTGTEHPPEQPPEQPTAQAPAGTEWPPEQPTEQPTAQAPAGTEQPPEQSPEQPTAQAPAGTERPPEQPTEQPTAQAPAGTEQPPEQPTEQPTAQAPAGTEQPPEQPTAQAPAGTERPPEQLPEQPTAQAPAGTERPPEQPTEQPTAQAPAGTERPPEQPTEQPTAQAPAGTEQIPEQPLEQPSAQIPAGTEQPPEQPTAQAPAGTEQPPEQPTAQAPAGTEQPPEQPTAQAPAGTEQPPEQPFEQPSAQAPAGTEQPPEQPTAQAPVGTEQPPEQPPVQAPVGTEQPPEQPPVQAPVGTEQPPEQPPVQAPVGTEQPPEQPPVQAPVGTEQPPEQPPVQAPVGTEQPPEQPPVQAPVGTEQPPEQPPVQAPVGTEQPPEQPPVQAPVGTEQPPEQPPVQAPAGTEQPPEQPSATTSDSLQSSCRPFVLCPAALADTASTGDLSCPLGDGSAGVICRDFGINPLELATHASGHRTDDRRNTSRPLSSDQIINDLFIVVGDDSELLEASKQAAQRIQEQKLQGSQTAPRDSPLGLFSLNSGSRHGLHKLGLQCLHHQLTLQAISEQGKSHLRLVSSFSGGQTGANASAAQPTRLGNCTVEKPIVCKDSFYRTASGECNNLQRPREGAARTGFKRLLESTFDGGVGAIRSRSVRDLPLPNPRLISERMVKTISKELNGFTLSVMQWGQFIDHDFNLAPFFSNGATDPITCCEDGGRTLPATPLHLQCIPFSIPADDPFYSQFGQRCMSMTRSIPAPPLDCIARPTTPLNAITSHLDASNIYGSDHEEQSELRAHRDGLLLTSDNNLLPLATSPEMGACTKMPLSASVPGDERVNEQSALTVMHTIFMREHNRVAGALKQNHRDWDDEKLFQEARRIVVAEWQHIVYNEWLPIIVGFDYARDHDLLPMTSGFSTFYDVHVNPTASNEFATAAFRFGHSLLRDLYHLINADGKIVQSINLTSTFFDPDVITRRFVEHARTLVATRCEAFDTNIISSVHQKLFMNNELFGLDLIAINIQRGRDHGIPTYTTMLKACTGFIVSSWGDPHGLIDSGTIDQLRSLYDDPGDVDLFIGGLAERQAPGAQVGPTFQCLIGQQFYDVRFGDRFFYDNGGFQHSFTAAQLKEIRKSSWARIMCDTLGPEFGNDFTRVQPLAFVEFSVGANGITSCGSQAIPSLNLAVFE